MGRSSLIYYVRLLFGQRSKVSVIRPIAGTLALSPFAITITVSAFDVLHIIIIKQTATSVMLLVSVNGQFVWRITEWVAACSCQPVFCSVFVLRHLTQRKSVKKISHMYGARTVIFTISPMIRLKCYRDSNNIQYSKEIHIIHLYDVCIYSS